MSISSKRGVGIVVNPKKAELAGRLREDPFRARERLERMTAGGGNSEEGEEAVEVALMAARGYSSMGHGCFKRTPIFN